MIPEEKFNADFGPIVSFYAFHVKKKSILISLNDIGMFGVNLEAKKHIKDIEQIDMNAIVPNAIYFSSSKKKHNVKNLMWYIRCSAHHPENIEIVNINGVEYYKLWCGRKDNIKKTIASTMKGLVACDVWPDFIKGLTNKIIEDEDN